MEKGNGNQSPMTRITPDFHTQLFRRDARSLFSGQGAERPQRGMGAEFHKAQVSLFPHLKGC